MSNLLNGKAALPAEMAIRFEKAFGVPADAMLWMQVTHDLEKVRRYEAELQIERVAA